MKMVYTHENHFLVNNIKNLIEAQSIKVFIKNEFSSGAVGEVSAFDSWPEVWIFDDHDYETAMKIVQLSQKNSSSIDWMCTQCAEENDASFEICWQCGADNNQ